MFSIVVKLLLNSVIVNMTAGPQYINYAGSKQFNSVFIILEAQSWFSKISCFLICEKLKMNVWLNVPVKGKWQLQTCCRLHLNNHTAFITNFDVNRVD